MLTIYTSNSMTRLAAALAEHLAAPLASPLTPEVVVALGPAMSRWVNLQLCRYAGIVANIDYPLPATTVWELARQALDDLPDDDPFAREVLAWRIYGLLPTLIEQPAFEALQAYLQDDPNSLKRWQLADRVADVFDRYQLYRPDLIRRWSNGEDSDWQALLWRQVLDSSGAMADKHRVASVDRLMARLRDGGRPPLPGLPQRLSLFAVSTLPPLFVEVFNAMAAVTEVNLYLQSPTPHYWSDLSTRKQLARQRLKDPESAHLWSVGNALLASWGRQGQAFQDLLLEAGPHKQDFDAFDPPAGDTLLSRIQLDIYELEAEQGIPEALPGKADGSLSVHVCHSAMRECQVLRDHLLGCMQNDPNLRPEEVLVLVPQITEYAPIIEAVFGHRSGCQTSEGESLAPPFIPWNLSDIAPLDEHPLVRIFLELLGLPESRFSHSEILSYLDVTALTEHFGLDRDVVDELREQLQASGLRWGWDAAHKADFELPETVENTWKQTLDRLFAGYAFGDDDELYESIAPLAGVEGDAAEALGSLRELLGSLDHFRHQLGRPHSPQGWRKLLSTMLDELFEQRDEDQGKLQQIRDAVTDLEKLALDGSVSDSNDDDSGSELSPTLVRYWLTQQLGNETRGGRYFRGGITFCGMKPMRGLPFKRIYLLGMQDQAYPRRAVVTEFDRMGDSWQHGDPRPGDEDRYLFLEALLAAREGLFISYTGLDAKDNSDRQPSVLLRELLDYLDERFNDPDDSSARPRPFSKAVTSIHPLQPYSTRNYRSADSASFDRYWRAVGERVVNAQPIVGSDCWPNQALPSLPEPPGEIPLEQLKRFLFHPPRYFVQTRLGAYFGDDDPQPQDDETFSLDYLQQYFVKQDLLDGYLAGHQATIEQFRARGELPHGGLGELDFNRVSSVSDEWLQQLSAYQGANTSPVLIDLNIEVEGHGPIQISGQLERHYPASDSGSDSGFGVGLMHAYPSSFKGKHLLGFWLDYLVLAAQRKHTAPLPARLFTRDQAFEIVTPLDSGRARAELAALLRLYLDGLDRPLPLLPNTGFAYALKPQPPKRGPAPPEQQARMKAANKAWDPGEFGASPGEKEDPYIQLLTRKLSGSPLEHPGFPRLAMALYGPALIAIGQGDA